MYIACTWTWHFGVMVYAYTVQLLGAFGVWSSSPGKVSEMSETYRKGSKDLQKRVQGPKIRSL